MKDIEFTPSNQEYEIVNVKTHFIREEKKEEEVSEEVVV